MKKIIKGMYKFLMPALVFVIFSSTPAFADLSVKLSQIECKISEQSNLINIAKAKGIDTRPDGIR